MIATLEITGIVSEVDPAGYVLVGGVTIALDTATLGLPTKGQAVRINARLADLPADPKDPPIWQAHRMEIYALAQPARPKEGQAPTVPHERAHHLPISSSGQPEAVAAAGAATVVKTGRFGAAGAQNARPATTAAAAAASKPHPTVAPQQSASQSRFQSVAATPQARPVQAAPSPAPAAAAPGATVSSFGSRFGKSANAPAARAPAQARPPFSPGVEDMDDDIPF